MAPSPPPEVLPPLSGSFTLTGHVVTTEGRRSIAGARVTLYQIDHAPADVTTDATGSFRFDAVPAGRVPYTISAAGCFYRSSTLDVSQSRDNVALDSICDSAIFSRAYYNQLVRNAYDDTRRIRLSRWTTSPSFYVRTVTSDEGGAVDQATLDGVRRVIENSVRDLSSGQLQVAHFEVGRESRPARDGWVRVDFMSSLAGGIDGQASAGPSDEGFIVLGYGPNFKTRRFPLDPGCESRTVEIADHEIVHTMGFFHTETWTEDFSSPGCTGLGRPGRVAVHAAVAYTRPFANLFEDADPDAFSIPLGGPAARRVGFRPAVVQCTLHDIRTGGSR
jgi:hypothetical protein